MDCLRCLEGEGVLTKLTYQNGDVQTMFLCDSCVSYFEADDTVLRIRLAQIA